MNKKKISWITPSCFIDVDLPIINLLAKDYSIDWQIVVENNQEIDYELYVRSVLKDNPNVLVYFFYLTYRLRSPHNIIDLIRIIKRARAFLPNLYYISAAMHPYGTMMYRLMLPKRNVVIACHNVSTPRGANSEKWAKKLTNMWIRSFKNIQVFSRSQEVILKEKVHGKNILMAHLALKDYGESTIEVNKKEERTFRFLFFGNIVAYKRVDLLIEAANILHDRGIENFKVRIAGSCNCNWEQNYASFIKCPDVFELMIKRIPNEDVANMFADSHVFVMPYQDIAQSGAITVAFRYNVVTLVSDIPQFKEFVEDGVTGLAFQSGNAGDLADKMQWCIENRDVLLKELSVNQKNFVDKELSLTSIVAKYKDFFSKL
ncbi:MULTISPECIES: glycosyltransferase family 4 protein [Bacteroides]|jgi:glycosyltransferase involved in cell wall biosynthesis|uniref:glycosyltransferase family 4 protein n=1 Tax=Bacteroides TaxID=816 RepID=UPI0001BC7FD0|nr:MULTISPECIES: glycosyltransferase family 4 protein [Bacteroides]EFS33658.1 hypothetical protein BSGG_4358 [Bacteroides sp. D2]QNL37908.1 glycosyltransferase family 4 protein [Bacteroides sp. M10]RGQ97302.1 glycosyltransferase [Bacteroides sp. AF26-7BH]RGY29120.1 glycosyltransferase [Bacteroides sp. OF02-3LB]UWN98681.1 glycosyltransferase family 4 protein [Bacteroides sp. D2]